MLVVIHMKILFVMLLLFMIQLLVGMLLIINAVLLGKLVVVPLVLLKRMKLAVLMMANFFSHLPLKIAVTGNFVIPMPVCVVMDIVVK